MKFKDHGPQGTGQGNKFLRLTSGQTVKVVFVGEIHEEWQLWVGGKSSSVVEGTPGAKLRFSVNVITTDQEGRLVAKIFQFGRPVFEQLKMLNTTYKDITTIKVAIARSGEKLDTVYMLMPLPNEPIGPQALQKIQSIPLLPLNTKVPESPAVDAFDSPPADEDGDPGFDPDTLPF